MKSNIRPVLLFLCYLSLVACKNETVRVQDASDSYLAAYKDAKILNDNNKISNREYDVGGGAYPYGMSHHYGPQYNYYGPPEPVYGPPPK